MNGGSLKTSRTHRKLNFKRAFLTRRRALAIQNFPSDRYVHTLYSYLLDIVKTSQIHKIKIISVFKRPSIYIHDSAREKIISAKLLTEIPILSPSTNVFCVDHSVEDEMTSNNREEWGLKMAAKPAVNETPHQLHQLRQLLLDFESVFALFNM